MKRKIFAVLIAFAFVAGTIGHTSADARKVNKFSELAVLLPESDMVMTLDSERFLNQALPQILSANQPMLSKINTEIIKIKDKTGLDLREFRQVAIGIRSKQISPAETDFEPVFLARGTVNAKMLVSVVKIASNGKYKTENVGGRTIYIFSPKEIIEENKDKIGGGSSIFDKTMSKMSKSLSKDIAVAAYDSNTIAFGSPARVRETVGNTARISNDVLGLLDRKPNSIINMGAKVPFGLSKFMPLDNDEFGKDLDSIRQMQGSMDVNEGNTLISFLAKTEQIGQAESLESNLQALQMVFSRILAGMKGADKKVYGRTLGNMVIARQTDEVSIDLTIPQSDIDVILGKK
jgi:hypothetical protein